MPLPSNFNFLTSILHEPIESTQIHHGDDFFVVEINHKWMFRFPRSQAAPAVLEIEKKFLAEFAPLSPVPIPVYEFQGSDFAGYRKIEGLLLSPSRYNALAFERRKRIVHQISAFLSVLHGFPVKRARLMGMSVGWDGWRENAFQTFKTEIATRLSHKAIHNAMGCFEEILSKTYNPVVIHGDFYPKDHLFFDPQQQELCGIIDFGDLTIEDPAIDLKNILSSFGIEVLTEVLENYHGPADAAMIERMRLLIRAEPLFDSTYDVQFGYPGRLTHAIREIEARFGR